MKRSFYLKTLCMAGVLALAALVVWSASTASGQAPYCGGWGAGCGINYPYGLYGSRVDEVPYFSMFPPVYYSVPVPRTYGWSPFAYPPGTMTPEVTVDNPQEIINPYVPQNKDSKPAKPTSARTAAFHVHTPQLLVNQYVAAGGMAPPASTQIASK
jgi:hypothetical protein